MDDSFPNTCEAVGIQLGVCVVWLLVCVVWTAVPRSSGDWRAVWKQAHLLNMETRREKEWDFSRIKDT